MTMSWIYCMVWCNNRLLWDVPDQLRSMEPLLWIGFGSASSRLGHRTSGAVLWFLAPRHWRQILWVLWLARRATLDWIYSGVSHWYLIGLGSGEFEGQVDTSSSVSCSWGHSSTILLCPRANCPAGGTTAIRECCCHEGVFWVSNRFWVVGSCQVASTLMPEPIVCQQNITSPVSSLNTSLINQIYSTEMFPCLLV